MAQETKKVLSVMELKARLSDVYVQLERLDQMAVNLQNNKRQLIHQIAEESIVKKAVAPEETAAIPEAPKKVDVSKDEKTT